MKLKLEPGALVPISFTLDCRWSSRGFNAEEATVTVIENETGEVIFRCHILRKRKRFWKHRLYAGSSKGMEGFGVLAFIKLLIEEGFTVDRFSHDNDATTKKHVMDAFPEAKEELCVCHAAKKFREHVIRASKKHKELRGYGPKAFQWLYYATMKTRDGFPDDPLCSEAVAQLRRRILHFSNHCRGDHNPEICSHKQSERKKPIENAEAIKELDAICELFANRAEQYVSGSNNNRLESYHGAIGHQMPKFIDSPVLYGAHVDTSLLRSSQGNIFEHHFLVESAGHRVKFPGLYWLKTPNPRP
jgi:hypothetical protein